MMEHTGDSPMTGCCMSQGCNQPVSHPGVVGKLPENCLEVVMMLLPLMNL
mgnify:CR=1 FL=1